MAINHRVYVSEVTLPAHHLLSLVSVAELLWLLQEVHHATHLALHPGSMFTFRLHSTRKHFWENDSEARSCATQDLQCTAVFALRMQIVNACCKAAEGPSDLPTPEHSGMAWCMRKQWVYLLVPRPTRHVKEVHELVYVIQLPLLQLLTVLATLLPR